MGVLITLPHADPTVRLTAPGRRVVELHRAAIARLTGLAARRSLCATLAAPSAASVAELALARAADRVLTVPADPVSRLIAEDMTLTLRSRVVRWPVRLRLDDLQLTEGSTESGVEVDRVSRSPLPFDQELEQARALIERDGDAVLWVERDQQLPGLFRLARTAGRALCLDGPFARRHRVALLRWLPRGSDLADTGTVPLIHAEFRPATGESVEGPPGGAAAPGAGPSGTDPAAAPAGPAWLRRDTGHRWVDQLSGAELAAAAGHGPPPGCAAAIVPIALAGPREVLTGDGTALTVAGLAMSVRALAGAGVPVLAEFWIGAPGTGTAELIASARWLAEAPEADLPWRVVGCRPFHLSSPGESTGATARPTWARRPVAVLPPPRHADLVRAPRFAGLAPAEIAAQLTAVLAARHRPVVGRLAGAYLAAAAVPAASSAAVSCPAPSLRFVPGVVAVPIGGRHLLVDLLTRRTFALHPRLGAALAALPPGAPLGTVLSGRVLDRAVALLSGSGLLFGAPPMPGGDPAERGGGR